MNNDTDGWWQELPLPILTQSQLKRLVSHCVQTDYQRLGELITQWAESGEEFEVWMGRVIQR
jgi:hypothetical protein